METVITGLQVLKGRQDCGGLRMFERRGETDLPYVMDFMPQVFPGTPSSVVDSGKAQADASIQIDTSTQDLARPLDSSEVWSPLSGKSSQSLPGTAEEADNPNPNSSDHESDSQSKDAHDVTHCAITDDDSEAWVPLSGQQSLSGAEASRTFDNLSESWTPLRGQQCLSGEEVSNVMGRDDSDHDFENFSEDTLDAQPTTSLQADRGEVTPRYSTSPLLFEDECSTEFDLHSSDPQHLSPTSQSSNNLIPDDLDESVDSTTEILEG
ncbi:uncharacterized protein LOC121528529 [Cheilinus undulatus]|uniref:uncharacterized protein LOC121528529 n=1 Tax=Cheilinus undulatus TaxID=241271 RepID=UPI001BD47EDA|nr:uncharacterized protein LOC121528529 [Cheilinus undulatus]